MDGFERFALPAMGTRFELLLESGPHARALAEEVFAEITDLAARLTVFRADGLLARINRLAVGEALTVDPEFFAVLDRALRFRKETAGLFDPMIGTAMATHGLRELREADQTAGAFVEPAFALHSGTNTVTRVAAHGAFDLGGLAKGEALEFARDCLLDHGAGRVLLHGGTSSVLALEVLD